MSLSGLFDFIFSSPNPVSTCCLRYVWLAHVPVTEEEDEKSGEKEEEKEKKKEKEEEKGHLLRSR